MLKGYVQQFLILCCVFLFLMSTGCGTGQDDRSLRKLIIEDSSDWWSVSNKQFLLYAQERPTLDHIEKMASYSIEAVKRIFAVKELVQSPTLYVIDEEKRWNTLISEEGLLSEGVSLQSGCEIVLFIKNEKELLGDSVSHEIIHYILHDQGFSLPLALEEGLALHYGWGINLNAHLAEGNVVTRKQKWVEPDDCIDFDELLAYEMYPTNAIQVKAFYDQSERLVRGISRLLDDKDIPAFYRKVGLGEDKDWQKLLSEEYGCTPSQLTWLRGTTSP